MNYLINIDKLRNQKRHLVGINLEMYLKSFCVLTAISLSVFMSLLPVAQVKSADTVYTDATPLDVEGDDAVSGLESLPFDFDFYGQTFNQFAASTNGVVSFDNPLAIYENTDLLDDFGLDNNSIYALWTDLDSYDRRTIYTKTIGTTGSRQFIIQWTNHSNHDQITEVPNVTMQVILYEGTNEIQIQYKMLLSGALNNGATRTTIGISNGVDSAEQYAYNTASVASGDAIRFSPSGPADYTIDDTVTYEEIYLEIPGQPSSFAIDLPAYGSTNIPLYTTLSWEPSSDADYYNVYLDTSDSFSDSTIQYTEIESTSLEASLQKGVQYYWMVQAINADDPDTNSRISDIYTFTTTTEEEVVLIETCEELMAFDESIENSVKSIKLANDIDCSGVSNFEPIALNDMWGTEEASITSEFTHTFDGQGYTISNLTIDYADYSEVGLFASIKNAEVKNLVLDGGSVTAEGHAGALVGSVINSTVSHVRSNISVSAVDEGMAGGLIGLVESWTGEDLVLEYLSSTGDVISYDDAGGLIGEIENERGNVTLRRSFATGNVTRSDETTGDNFGGLIGDVENITNDSYAATLTIEDTYATGDVTGFGSVGGLIGDTYTATESDAEIDVSELHIRRSYAIGTVSGNNKVGGLIGEAESFAEVGEEFSIENTFSTGVVSVTTGPDIGGFLGFNEGDSGSGNFEIDSEANYFNNLELSDCNGGFDLLEDCTGIDLSTDASYFKGNTTNTPLTAWDFEGVWRTVAGGYPELRWQDDGIVSVEDGTPILISPRR